MDRYDTALLLLRAAFGLSMSYHGLNKIRGNGLAGTAGWFGSMGMKWPKLQAFTAATSEIVFGLLLTVGFISPLACVAIIALMTVAIYTVHGKVGYFIFLPNGGWEYCASIIAVCTAIGFAGPGEYSIDNALNFSTSWGTWALPLGLLAASLQLLISYRPVRQK